MSKFNVNGLPILADSVSQAISIFYKNHSSNPFIRLVVKPW